MSISKRVWTICAVLVVSCLLTALLGVLASTRLSGAQGRTLVTATALRHHLEGDAMHDALRADVLSAIYGSSRGDRKTVRAAQADLARHSAAFERAIAANRRLLLPGRVRAALNRADRPLAAYIAHAREMVELAERDSAAAVNDFAHFREDWEAVQRATTAATDELEAAMDEDRAAVALWSALWTLALIVSLATGLAAGAWVTHMLLRDVVHPIRSLTRSLALLSEGELHTVIEGAGRTDEIGGLAKGLVRYKEAMNAVHAADLARQKATEQFGDQLAKREAEASAERRTSRQALADQLERRVLRLVAQVGSACEALGRAAEEMKGSALGTRQDVAAAAKATEDAAGNVAIVGSAADELAMSIAEISRRSESSALAAQTMAQRANAVAGQMRELEEATGRIAHVSALINDVAQHTNLLALNATIEAARAGASGAGFAVVAAEIRSLAEQAAASTSEISGQIGSVLRTADQVAGAVREVEEAVVEVEVATSSISSAVEQQSRATGEISESMQRTVRSTEALRGSMGGVERQASATDSVASTVAHAAVTLGAHAGDLQREVADLIAQIREAA